MEIRENRSTIYGAFADTLTKTCTQFIDNAGHSTLDGHHGSPSLGHVAYVMGELSACRPEINLTSVHDKDLVCIMRSMIQNQLDLSNEIHRCFVAMGLGMFGLAGDTHMVLRGMDEDLANLLRDGLVVTKEFDNNWEAFNGCILIGRHLLYGDPAELTLQHFEKIAKKFDQTGYFDDTLNLGNYNNYGLMSINYPLRASEYLDENHPVRITIEERFKDHALRYVELIRKLVSPKGDTWPFGRSAGVLGQLQCIVLIEQCLSKRWIRDDEVNDFRAIARRATRRMQNLYWDESLKWFSFRDDHHTGYNYRASFPMAWDMLRYFLQIENYAAMDEQLGIPEHEVDFHVDAGHWEIVTNPTLKTAVYVWSDGDDHAVLPIMAGPHAITGDSLARPYAQGLFEWTTEQKIPALCPRLTIDANNYWPSWRAKHTELIVDGENRIYQVLFDNLYSDSGKTCPHAISCDTRFIFSSKRFERIDIWNFQEDVVLDSYALEVLQPAKHPQRPHFGDVYQLSVTWKSELEDLQLIGKQDVSGDPVYRNYHAHVSHSWKIGATQVPVKSGMYKTALQLQW